jgi:hypothetical protein
LRQVLLVLSALVGRPADDRQINTFALALYPVVTASRERSFQLARALITSINPRAPQVKAPDYQPEFLAQALRRTLVGLEDPNRGQRAVVQAAAAVVRHTEQAGREGMISSVQADPEALGWARVARGGHTCAFCLLLVSRGPVYKSEATGAFRSHPACDCVAVPVYDRNDWPGREQFLAADKLYREATKGERDQLNAFRRAVDSGDVSSDLPTPVAA